MKITSQKVITTITVITMLLTSSALWAGGQQESMEDSSGTSFTWWALSGGGGVDDPRENCRKEIIEEYTATHPDVQIDLVMLENEAFKQKIQVAIQAGDPPDLFHSWGGGVMAEYAAAGVLKDITEDVQNDLSSSIGARALNVYSSNGRYYGAPYDMGAVGVWYNKEIFAKAGVKVPSTWSELLTAVPKSRQPDIPRFPLVPEINGPLTTGGFTWP